MKDSRVATGDENRRGVGKTRGRNVLGEANPSEAGSRDLER